MSHYSSINLRVGLYVISVITVKRIIARCGIRAGREDVGRRRRCR